MSNAIQFRRPVAGTAPAQLLRVTLPGTRIDAEVTLNKTERGWSSEVFCWGHWEAGGVCNTRDEAITAALSCLCDVLYRETEDAA